MKPGQELLSSLQTRGYTHAVVAFLVVEEGHHGVRVAPGLQAGQQLLAGLHRPAPLSSNTSGGSVVSPTSHRNTRRGTISMMARSKNSGSATRLPRKKSMAGSFLRHIGRTL